MRKPKVFDEDMRDTQQAEPECQPGPAPTHIIMTFGEHGRDDLYRADTGMLLASRQADCVRFGVEPKETGNRFFLDHECAARWIRLLPRMEMYTRTQGRLTLADAVDRYQDPAFVEPADIPAVVIEERNGQGRIHLVTAPSASGYKV